MSMTPFEYLNKHVLSIIKPSPISGVGFFAVRDINEGESIFEPWFGETGVHSITHEELFQLPEELQKYIYETFTYEFHYTDKESKEVSIVDDYGKVLFPLQKGNHWVFTFPKLFINSGLSKSNVDTNGKINPLASRKIKKGEELLGNYGSTFTIKPKNFI